MLIDGKEVLKKIYELRHRATIFGHKDVEDVLDELIRFVDFAPTIEERKTGRWEFVSYGDGLGNYHCSECRAIASSYFVGNLVNRHWEYKLTKYCPKCGAKMEGAEE